MRLNMICELDVSKPPTYMAVVSWVGDKEVIIYHNKTYESVPLGSFKVDMFSYAFTALTYQKAMQMARNHVDKNASKKTRVVERSDKDTIRSFATQPGEWVAINGSSSVRN